jgi:hypothetical protein
MLELWTTTDGPAVAALSLGTGAVLVAALYYIWRRRKTPAEQERRRRLKVSSTGRTTDGVAMDMDSPVEEGAVHLIHYRYAVGGVEYSAAQDVSALLDRLGDKPSRCALNSIIVCEDWSGLRAGRGARNSLSGS